MPEIDLAAYWERIGMEPPLARDTDALAALQRAHLRAIPFENLDIPLGRGISLDPDQVFAKLVTRRRGGYCFEQNQLFLRVMQALGIEACPLLGRVWLNANGVPGRSHMLNLATVEGRDWIVDVGFGGTPAPLLPLEADRVETTPDGVRHRLRADAEYGWMLERDGGAGWQRQYSFTLDPAWPSDFAFSNHYTSTAPGTRFTTFRIVSKPTEDGFVALTDRRLRLADGDVREIDDPADYRAALASLFGIVLTDEEVAKLGIFQD